MRLVIQRAKDASVTAEGQLTGRIEHGFVVFLGVSDSDTEEIADKMVKKLIGLRIFEDENGNPALDNIASDEEMEKVSDRFDEWLDEQEFEEL